MISLASHHLNKYKFEILAALGLSFLSTWLILLFGKIGFHFHDLSIVFDGGYRITQGQLPFVDFFSPIGPIVFLQQALFFNLFGVNINAYLMHAAFLNILASIFAYLLLKSLDRGVAVIATGTTVFWFYLPPSAPYIDTTALFWGFAGFVILFSGTELGVQKPVRVFIAGIFVAISILTKQNIGIIAAALFTLVLIVEKAHRELISLFLGILLPVGSFIIYLVFTNGINNFVYYATIPLESARLVSLLPQAAKVLWNIVQPQSARVVYWSHLFYELGLYASLVLLGIFYIKRRHTQSGKLSLLTGTLLVFQYASFETSFNDWVLYGVFYGVIGAGAGFLLVKNFPRRLVILGIIGLGISGAGFYISATRMAHGINPSEMTYTTRSPGLSGLRLSPQMGQAIDDLLIQIKRDLPPEDNIFIYPFHTIIYGLAGRPAPQPLLWFFRDVTYSTEDNSRTDQQIVEKLANNNVIWIIIEKNHSRLDEFPLLESFIDQGYIFVQSIADVYLIYQKADP